MAVIITKSAFLLATPDDLTGRPWPIDNGGKMRILHSTFLQVGAGDIGSQFQLMEAPFGRVRFLPYLARFKNSAFGASCTLSLGLGAYYNASIPDPVSQTAEDDTCLGAATTVASAGGPTAFTSAPMKFDVYSRGPGPMVLATIAGAVVPDAATLEILLPYIQD